MKGTARNMSNTWVHALKREVRPGGELQLDDLYEQYGKKYNIPTGQPFVDWLREVKLKDTERWKITLLDTSNKPKASDRKEAEVQKGVNNEEESNTAQSSITPKTATVQDIIELSVRKARTTLPKIHDLKLLRYSLQEANVLSGKDSLCLELKRRIRQLEIGRSN